MSLQFEIYTKGDSFIYRMDPRVKILGVLVIFLISVLFTHPLFLSPFFFAILALNVLGRVPFRQILILLKSLSLLVIISFIMWPLLFHPGQEIFRWGGIYITDLGVAYGIAMAFRILNMVIAPITLMLTTQQSELILGLRGIGLPPKAAFALATAFRFLPTVVGIGSGIIEAQRSRGLDVSKGGLLERTRNYAAILGPLMISSLRIAQQLALAVESKGMSSTAKRTTVRELRYDRTDRAVLIGFAVLVILVIGLRLLGYGAFNF
jgi:energy-coupling factor transport system permease protein